MSTVPNLQRREEPGQDTGLPEGWAETTLTEVCEINPPKPPVGSIPSGAPVTFVPMPAVDAELGAITKPETRPYARVRNGYTSFREGDVIMAKITPCMENGKAAIARNLETGLGFGSTEFHVLRPTEAVLAEFVYHFIRQESYRNGAESEMTGSVGQKRVPAELLKSTTLPLPPLAEQKRIVTKIEELLERNRAARQRLARVPLILKAFRQAVLAAACSGHLTEDWREGRPDIEPADKLIERIRQSRLKSARGGGIVEPALLDGRTGEMPGLPTEWCWVVFGTVVAELRNGISTKPEQQPPGNPILRISSVRSGAVLLNDVRYLPDSDDLVQKYALVDDDLLFTRYNGSLELLGVCGMVRGLGKATLLYPDKLMRVRFDHPYVLPHYAEIFFQSPGARHEITAKSKSSAGQQGISGADVKAQPFALPSLEEQKEIVRRVEALFKLADRIEKRVQAATKRADKLGQAILAKAFRGELVPTEAELGRHEGRDYESASVLLERIRRRQEGSRKTGRHNSRLPRQKDSGRKALARP